MEPNNGYLIICISLRYRGMGSSSKILSHKILVEVYNPYIMLLKYMWGEGEKLVSNLEKKIGGGSFCQLMLVVNLVG